MPEELKAFHARRLPHIQSAARPLFITWRLKFDLPKQIIHMMKAMFKELEVETQHLSKDLLKLHTYTFETKRFVWFDEQLTKVQPLPISLAQPEIANLIKEVLLYHNGQRYDLYAYCIMPNHVHVIIQLSPQLDGNPFPLPKITQSWKRHSSMKIKMLLNISDSVWQAESYDHVIRNEKELSYYLEYILDNPVKAGLVNMPQDWEHTWINHAIQ